MIVVTLWQVLKHQITNYLLAVPYDSSVAARRLIFDSEQSGCDWLSMTSWCMTVSPQNQ